MSAFIVSDETMHRVVQAMDHIQPAPNDGARTILGRMLFIMNNDAVRARYDDRYPDMFCDPLAYTYEPREATVGELYRAVACFLYQCSEGDVPSAELYLLMQKVEGYLERDLTGEIEVSDARTTRAMQMTDNLPWDF